MPGGGSEGNAIASMVANQDYVVNQLSNIGSWVGLSTRVDHM